MFESYVLNRMITCGVASVCSNGPGFPLTDLAYRLGSTARAVSLERCSGGIHSLLNFQVTFAFAQIVDSAGYLCLAILVRGFAPA